MGNGGGGHMQKIEKPSWLTDHLLAFYLTELFPEKLMVNKMKT